MHTRHNPPGPGKFPSIKQRLAIVEPFSPPSHASYFAPATEGVHSGSEGHPLNFSLNRLAVSGQSVHLHPTTFANPKSGTVYDSLANASTMSGTGGFYKYRCKYFYTYNCPNWVYCNGHACAMCLVVPHLPDGTRV